MRELEAAVADATHELVKSGKLKELVAKNVESTVATIVRDALSSYSEFGKQLAEAINTSLKVDPGALGLPAYNQTVLTVIRRMLDGRLEELVGKKLQADLDKMLGADAPKEITLSELVKQFKERASGRHAEPQCTIVLEPPNPDPLYTSRWLYLDESERKSKYECRIQMLVGSDGNVSICRLGGQDPKKSLFMGVLYGFERTIFMLYAAGTRLLIDQESFETDLDRSDD